jgi:hypothetical protein
MTDGTPLRILFVAHHVIDRNAGVGGTTLALHDALRAQGHAVHTYGYQDAFPDGTSRASRSRGIASMSSMPPPAMPGSGSRGAPAARAS